MHLDMGDPTREGIAKVLCRDSLSLAFRLKEPELTIIDCANPAAVPLNPSQTVSRCGLEGAVA